MPEFVACDAQNVGITFHDITFLGIGNLSQCVALGVCKAQSVGSLADVRSPFTKDCAHRGINVWVRMSSMSLGLATR